MAIDGYAKQLTNKERSALHSDEHCIECDEELELADQVPLPCGNAVCRICFEISYHTCTYCNGHDPNCTFGS